MEYYDSTPSRLNIKLQNIPLGRTTNNDYLRIYNGLNQTLPIMQHEFSNLKYRAKEFNNSMSIPQINSFINNDISNNFNYQINNSQRIIDNNYGFNNNFNQSYMNNNFTNYNNYRNYNNNFNINQGNNLEKTLERDMLINQFQDLMEVCYEKLKQYKNENENLKMKIGKNISNNINNKNMMEENEYINEENNNEEENENYYESPYLKYFLKKDNLNMEDNSNKMKQITNLGKDLNDLIVETKVNQEKYDNQLMELVNKLSSIGNKMK